ncbi:MULTISPECIES: hypothetical protein [unclassified Paraburkholderia]|uniref:hypothetical protein n=1 Tax=unclassified Paraburkholderia TaxID=2615204 RepID=UPI00286EF5B1|nr:MULTISPECIES: hypothetical protein [unclassified Paraburkholderia]
MYLKESKQVSQQVSKRTLAPLVRYAVAPALLCALLAGCDKHDQTASDLANKSADAAQQAVQAAASQASAQAAQALGHAASFVNQQLDSAQRQLDHAASQTQATIDSHVQSQADRASDASASIAQNASDSSAELASQARGQWREAASAAHAMLGNAAAATGTGLSIAGHSLQRWAASDAAAGSSPGASQ